MQATSSLALPVHDRSGRHLAFLPQLTDTLSKLFSQVFLSISPATAVIQASLLAQLVADPLYICLDNPPGSTAGDHFFNAFEGAVTHSRPEQLLHLATIDRLAYIMNSDYAATFSTDVLSLSANQTPLLFQRSGPAWASHPTHYRDMEQIATRIGFYLYGRELDFAWCHLVITAADLTSMLPAITRRDFGLLAEFVVQLQARLKVREVDWLAWEDPFIYGRPAADLMTERDQDPGEIQKRLSWMKGIWQVLLDEMD